MTEFEIYTDGATSGNGYEGAQGGWAWILLHGDRIIIKKMGHINEATNNICELSAIIDACQTVWGARGELVCNPKVTVYSDSAYVINCYKQKWYKKWQVNGWVSSKKQPVANRKLWELLIPYFENPYFHFEKVAGHADNKYNNLVDEMAVEAKFIDGVKEWLM
jgi:ribonuclease HI